MTPDPKTPKDWALLCVAQWGRSEEFPGHPFPGLVEYIELAVKGTVEQAREPLLAELETARAVVEAAAKARDTAWDEANYARLDDALDAYDRAKGEGR